MHICAIGNTQTKMNNHAKWAALGGLGAAIGSTACCILPLVLFSLGISGAWIGTLTSLNQYQPLFVAVALLCFAVGFYWVYFKPKPQCEPDSYCAKPASNRMIKMVLWCSLVLIALALAFPLIAPLFLT